MHIRIDDFLAAGRHLRRALGGQVSPVRSGSPGRSLTEADRKWLLNAEHVPGPGLGRELVRTLSEGQDRDLRVRFQLDDLVRREPGLGVLPYLLTRSVRSLPLRRDTTSVMSSRSDAW
jgi:hypothetical protein